MRWKTTLTVAQRRKPCDSGSAAREYEIDLSKKNARAFRKGLSQFVEHARKAGRAQSAAQHARQQTGIAAETSGPGQKWESS
jgi:hypothetical protein